MVPELDFKDLTFKELGVLGYLMGVPIQPIGRSRLPIGRSRLWIGRSQGDYSRRLSEGDYSKETIRRRLSEGDYPKETIRRSGAHDIFWSGAHDIFY